VYRLCWWLPEEPEWRRRMDAYKWGALVRRSIFMVLITTFLRSSLSAPTRSTGEVEAY
jgi:hypothetical protein